jgi:hypothetical protein
MAEEKSSSGFSFTGCGCLVVILLVIGVVCYYMFGHWFTSSKDYERYRKTAIENNKKLASTYDFFESYDVNSGDSVYNCLTDFPIKNTKVIACYYNHLKKFKKSNYELNGDLKFLTSSSIEMHPVFEDVKKNRGLFLGSESIEEIGNANLLAVFFIEKFEKPVFVEKGGFTGGLLKGKMVLFDMNEQKIYCIVPIEAESGELVKFKDRKLDLKDKNDHLMDELAEEVVLKARSLLSQINSELSFRKNISGRDNDL